MKAQVYHPMFTDSAKWNYLSISTSIWMPWNATYQTFSFKIDKKKDTLINQQKYFQVLYNTFIREDSLSKKVFVHKDSSEYILFDFSLNKGDSFYFNFPEFINIPSLYGWDIVDTVYQTQTIIGLRKTIRFRNSYHFEWVEEIGSTRWIYYPEEEIKSFLIGNFPYYSLLCAWKNNNQIYLAAGRNTCYIDNTGIQKLSSGNNISLFPNPTTSTFTISKNTNEALKFHLYNLMGQQVLNKNLIESETIIERNNLATCTYLFSITNASGRIIENGKLIFE